MRLIPCNESNMLAWVLDLESDLFQQGQNRLCTWTDHNDLLDPKHCCLGVAGETSIRLDGLPLSIRIEDFGGVHYGDSPTGLDPMVSDWLGLPPNGYIDIEYEGVVHNQYFMRADPFVGFVGEATAKARGLYDWGFITASTANDTYRWNFRRIAKGLRSLYLP